MFREFREFLEKFNVIPVAVGLVLALAFLPLVNAIVNLITSIVAKVIGIEPTVQDDGTEVYEFANWFVGGINLGAVINAFITFVMIAFVVFMIVKSLNRAGAKTDAGETPDQALLGEIRDLLKAGR